MTTQALPIEKESPLRPAQGASFGAWAPTPVQKLILVLAHHTPLGRGRGRRLAAAMLRRLRDGPIDYTLGGSPFRFDIRDNSTDRQSLLHPGYNREEFEFLADTMGEGGVFVDIGANVGFFSVKLAARCGAGCRVIAIEPNPVVLERLRFNTDAMRDRITVVDQAAGRAEGVARFQSGATNLGESRFDANGEIEVQVRPLQSILQSQGVTRVDALKIDVEGFEDDVILPFFATAPKTLWPKRIVIEFTARADWKDDCIACLQDCGYVLSSKTRGNMLFELGDAATHRLAGSGPSR